MFRFSPVGSTEKISPHPKLKAVPLTAIRSI
jgi:hypothetical protein